MDLRVQESRALAVVKVGPVGFAGSGKITRRWSKTSATRREADFLEADLADAQYSAEDLTGALHVPPVTER